MIRSVVLVGSKVSEVSAVMTVMKRTRMRASQMAFDLIWETCLSVTSPFAGRQSSQSCLCGTVQNPSLTLVLKESLRTQSRKV